MSTLLAILPPLHQDFRARQFLCSPGDGWRQYKPPPPPTVQPAFHFLSSLLDPDAYASLHPHKIPRPVLDSRLYGKLQGALQLPNEVLGRIIELVTEDGAGLDLALASRSFHHMVMPHLYRNVTLRSKTGVTLFCKALELEPKLGLHIRQLCFDMKGMPWTEVSRLTELLRRSPDAGSIPLNCLTLRGMPASELQTALPILQSFAPRSFVWHTAPSWQMRPAQLFLEMFCSWRDSLQHVTMENFRFDQVLVSCVAQTTHLSTLTLRGNGVDHLEADVIACLLEQPLHLSVAGCNSDRRMELQAGLMSCDRPVTRLTWN